MELSVVDRWSDASVYFDSVSRRLMHYKKPVLHLVNADTFTKTKMKLPSVDAISHVALSPDSRVLAFVQDECRLVRTT